MKRYTIAVTGLNESSNPQPGMGVVRSLRAERGMSLRIIGLTYDLLSTGAYAEDLLDAVYLLPNSIGTLEGGRALFQRLKEIIKKEKIDLLIPTLDFELPVFIALKSKLKELKMRTLLPSNGNLENRSKLFLSGLGRKGGFDVPKTVALNDRRQISRNIAAFSFPMVLKAALGEAVVVYSLEELKVFFNRYVEAVGFPLLLQEFINGEEYNVAFLADRGSRIAGYVVMKKMVRSEKGDAWMGITVEDKELKRKVMRIAKVLHWVGPGEMEFVRSSADNRYFLIEVNPRFPAWIHFAASAGQNLPAEAVRIALSRKKASSSNNKYRSGLIFARYAVDITSDISLTGRLLTEGEVVYSNRKIILNK